MKKYELENKSSEQEFWDLLNNEFSVDSANDQLKIWGLPEFKPSADQLLMHYTDEFNILVSDFKTLNYLEKKTISDIIADLEKIQKVAEIILNLEEMTGYSLLTTHHP